MRNNEASNNCTDQGDDRIIVSNEQHYITLFEISFRTCALVGSAVPVLALIIDFLLGFLVDYQQILDYDWSCGPVNIPSLSRIINLPKERIIWNAALLFHIPLRLLIILVNYRICRIPANEACGRNNLHAILSWMIIPFGSVEILMVLLLTVIGEREEITYELNTTNFNWHVCFFMTFAIVSGIYFAAVTTTYRQSRHYVEHSHARWSFNLKFYLTLTYITVLPMTFIFFSMYWILCYNFAYNFFALSEYMLLLVNNGFHASVIYDCNDIWIFRMKQHYKVA